MLRVLMPVATAPTGQRKATERSVVRRRLALVSRRSQCAPVLLDLNDLDRARQATMVLTELAAWAFSKFAHSAHFPSTLVVIDVRETIMNCSIDVHCIAAVRVKMSAEEHNDSLAVTLETTTTKTVTIGMWMTMAVLD